MGPGLGSGSQTFAVEQCNKMRRRARSKCGNRFKEKSLKGEMDRMDRKDDLKPKRLSFAFEAISPFNDFSLTDP
jgi:hypothetical protein